MDNIAMELYIKDKTPFDFSSAELIFFYIHDFTVFKEQGFCFYPKYNVVNYKYNIAEDSFYIVLNTNKDFIDLFSEEKVNVKVICGKNGCGKSTLLEVMAGTKYSDAEIIKFYLLRDKYNNFASTCKCNIDMDDQQISLNYADLLNDFYPHHCCVNHKNMQVPDLDFRKNIVKSYKENPSLYDGIIDDKLFTHFSVELWDFDNKAALLYYGNRRALFKNENFHEIKQWLKSDIMSYFFLCASQDNTYDDVAEIFEKQMQEDEIDLYTYINDFVFSNYNSPAVDEVGKYQKEILSKSFPIADLEKVEKKIASLEEKVFEFLKSFNYEINKNRFISLRVRDLLYFRGYSDKTTQHRFVYDLSDGEWNSIKFRYEILHSMFQSNGLWWYIDEPEVHLHPEWCRTFIYDYMESYKSVKKYLLSIRDYNPANKNFNPDKRFTLVFATHSPFLLSDLTKDYILYLEKENGQTKEICAEKECFAGNIGEMYNTNFFMQNTIGQFSYNKIKSIIDGLNNDDNISDEILIKWKQLINKIGDDLLRNLLKDKILMYEKNKPI